MSHARSDIELLAETARAALAELPTARRAPPDSSIAWAIADEMGWFELLRPEPNGGLGLPLSAAVGVCLAAGEVAFPGPVAEAISLGAAVDADDRRSFTLGWVGPASRGPRAALVQLGQHTRHALLVVPGEREFQSGDIVQLPHDSHGDQACELGLVTPWGSAEVPPTLLSPHDTLTRWLLLTAAYELGMANAALSLSVRHALTREQFGRPVGGFQSVQQLLAQMQADAVGCQCLLDATARDIDDGVGTVAAAAGARAHVARSARSVVERAVQVHGGIGFTQEVPLHLFLKRSRTWSDVAGSPEALAELVGRQRLSALTDRGLPESSSTAPSTT